MKAARFTVAILIALLLCMAYGGNAQTKNDKPSTVEVVKQIIPDSAKLTLKTVYDDAKGALSSLGAALKVGSEHVYEVLVRQQLVESITWLSVYLIIFGVGLPISFKVYRVCEKDHFDSPLLLIPVFTWFGIGATFFCTISTVITGFVNPEYGALKQILNLIKH